MAASSAAADSAVAKNRSNGAISAACEVDGAARLRRRSGAWSRAEFFCRVASLRGATMQTTHSRVVIITGASGNLGFATARAFQQHGARTVLVDRARDRLLKAFPGLEGSSEHMLAAGIDLAEEASVAGLLDEVLQRFGQIDTLVHTVGAWRGGSHVHETSLDDWSFLFDANVRTTLVMVRAVAPHLIRQRRGHIISVAARAGFLGEAGAAAYAAAKSAVLRLNESLSAELKHHGVNVNCVLPATIDTPQNRAAMPDADHTGWVQPEAIADVILFLASDAARAVHGAAVPVYGLG